MKREINFDMDGTLADFYGVKGWLKDLQNKNARPYNKAKPLVDCEEFSYQVRRLQAKGFKVKIISWLSKTSDKKFDKKVIKAKLKWLKKYFPEIDFDKIDIVKYGEPKSQFGNDLLFDDELANRKEWKGVALSEKEIVEYLKIL